MNQIVHILGKDCRRLWRTILAGLVFTVLNAYGDIANLGGYAVSLSPFTLFLILVGLSGTLLPIMLFLLVVSVIQEESLVGSDKFWLTRPYSRRSLAIEKFLFVLLFAFLSMLLHDVWLIRYFGFSLSSASGLLLWKDAQFAFFLLVAATIAVLSANFARAVLVAIAASFGAVLIFLVVLRNYGGPSTPGPSATPIILAILALAACGALSVIIFQYRFRITPVAALVGIAAIFACALLARFCPTSLRAYLSDRYTSPQLRSIQLLPDAKLTGLARPPAEEKSEVQARTVYYPFRAVGLEGDVGIAVDGVSAKFFPSGQKEAAFYIPQRAHFQATASSRLFADTGGPDQVVSLMIVQPNDSALLRNADGALTGKLYFDGFRASVVKLPVPAPSQPRKFAIAGRRCSVEAGQRESRLVLWFNCVELEPGNTSQFQVHLLQDSQEIIPQGTSGSPSSQGSWPDLLTPIRTTNSTFEFSPPVSAEILSSGSPKGREMLIFEEESLGREERPFRIDNFRPGDLTLEAWQQRNVFTGPEQHLAPLVLPPRPHE